MFCHAVIGYGSKIVSVQLFRGGPFWPVDSVTGETAIGAVLHDITLLFLKALYVHDLFEPFILGVTKELSKQRRLLRSTFHQICKGTKQFFFFKRKNLVTFFSIYLKSQNIRKHKKKSYPKIQCD